MLSRSSIPEFMQGIWYCESWDIVRQSAWSWINFQNSLLVSKPTWLAISKEKMQTTYWTWAYQCLRPGFTPPCLHDIFQPIHKQYQHHTPLSNNGVLISRAHTNMMSRSFCYIGAVLCNSFPDNIKGISKEITFRAAFKMFLMNSSWNMCCMLICAT